MNKAKKIHFVGIKGVGMAPLAIIAKEAGCSVSGSDIEDVFITDEVLKKAGIEPLKGFSENHIQNTLDLVITTGAHGGFDNPEVLVAKNRNIPVVTQGEAVGMFMKGTVFGREDTKGISVAGCHGKTTTTAMIATILKDYGMDPSFVIGTGAIESLGLPGHYGKGSFFIAEADEYATEPKYDKKPKFLWQKPEIAVITNIEFDHPDLYANIDEVRVAYEQFSKVVEPTGFLIVCGDDRQVGKLLSTYTGKVITYGFSEKNDYVLKDVRISSGQTFFWAEAYGANLGQFSLKVIGEHNALNALCAALVGLEAGIPIEAIKKGLLSFVGTKRRFEFLGTLPSGALVFDDYAHHPTEIEKTLTSMRKNYPKHHITCIFQPHTYSRTKQFFSEFSQAFSAVDTLILTDIYSSLREEIDLGVSSELLVDTIRHNKKEVFYRKTLQDVIEYIASNQYNSKHILITMGAGDVYKIAEQILKIHE